MPVNAALRCLCSLAGLSLAIGAVGAGRTDDNALTRQDLQIVDCLLPGEVRELGNMSYVSARRPIRTSASECRIRGGEYVAYDRADYKSALKVWMDAANAGDIEAATNVGEIYERGLGGTPNYEAAIIWYRKVIDDKSAGDERKSRALFNLGTLYEQGHGVEKDPLQALNLYRRAWGVPEDSLMYTSAKDREVDAVRQQLEEAVAEKDQQIQLMERQLQELRQRSGGDAATIERLIHSLQEERAASQKRLAAMAAPAPRVAVSSSPGEIPTAVSGGTLKPGTTAGTREPVASVDSKPASDAVAVRSGNVEYGRFFALVIGNQNYDQLEPLVTPRSDAERVAAVLKDKYGFTVQVIEDANDVAMLRALNDLNKVLKPGDNLLLYYAGHGFRLPSAQAEDGYWLPRNAERPPNDTFWIPNEQITRHIGRMAARRILVVADSCYAGLLSADPSYLFLDKPGQITTDYIAFKLPKRARLLMSSGGDRPVLDEGGQGNSMFARAFLDVLTENDRVLTAPALFYAVLGKVKTASARNHFAQQPEFKSIKGAGHEFGDFFFVPRSGAKVSVGT